MKRPHPRFFNTLTIAALFLIFASFKGHAHSSPAMRLAELKISSVTNPDTLDKFYEHLMRSIGYPAEAREKTIMGTVVIAFDFMPDGKTANFAVVKTVGGGCEESVISVLKRFKDKSGAIKPGRYHLPVTFVLGGDTPIEPVDDATKALPNLLKQIVITGVYR